MNNEAEQKFDLAGIDRILATDEQIAPCSGFFAATMERVRDAAAAPPPIPFPWSRAIPGIVLVAGVLSWGIWTTAHYVLASGQQLVFSGPTLSLADEQNLAKAGWVALALIISYGSWRLSARLMRRSSLL